MNYRNRDLLDLAYLLPCTLRLPGCIGGVSVPCHSNQSAHGKGMSIKAHDNFFAAGCAHCHHEIDFGCKLTREERESAWARGHCETFLTLWKMEAICVNPQFARSTGMWECAA